MPWIRAAEDNSLPDNSKSNLQNENPIRHDGRDRNWKVGGTDLTRDFLHLIRGSSEVSPDCKIEIWGPDATSNISMTSGISSMQLLGSVQDIYEYKDSLL